MLSDGSLACMMYSSRLHDGFMVAKGTKVTDIQQWFSPFKFML